MAGLESGRTGASVVILFASGPDSPLRLTSMTYLMRCPVLISLSTRNFRLHTCWSRASDLYDNRTVQMGFSERDSSGSVQAT